MRDDTDHHSSPETAELLPCPFCGESVAEIIEFQEHKNPKKYFRVRCDECWAQSHGSYHLSRKGAAEAWNTRARPAQCAPDGWQLVPVEPTLEMLHASTMQVPTWDNEASRRKWQEMLAAAPSPVTSTNRLEAVAKRWLDDPEVKAAVHTDWEQDKAETSPLPRPDGGGA